MINNKVKVLQINTVYGIKSTGSICRDIETELDNHELEFHMAYSFRGEIAPKREFIIGNSIDRKIHALGSHITGLQGYFSSHSTKKLIQYIKNQNINVVHIHNIHTNNINLEILFSYLASNKIKTILTLHDCWFYTGKCMYYTVSECQKWKTSCNNCPQLKEGNPSWFFDMTRKSLSDKKKWFSNIKNLAIIGVSDWITNEAKKSILKDAAIIRRIYNWADTDLYKPRNNTPTIKGKIGLKDNDFFILAVASTWTERKGLDFLIECAKELVGNTKFVIVGHINEEKHLPLNCIHIKETHDLDWLASLYSAADIFINVSMEESFGKVTVEAMAAGTPVIVINSTANPELLGKNCGHIVNHKDKKLVVEAINLVRNNTKSFYSEYCINHARNNFQKDKILAQYRDLYTEIANC